MITGSKVRLRDKRLSDAWNDYNWESDPELAYLDACEPLAISFEKYLADYSDELCHSFPGSRRLAIETLDGEHIGNCSVYHIDEKSGECEIGIMIGDRAYWDKGYGTDAMSTLVDYVFSETKLKRIYLKTLESNKRAQNCFQKCGFCWCGRLRNSEFNFALMEIFRKNWEKDQAQDSRP
ncbi:MAG: GNAT family N-acetyltransferase [Chloroflexi bacterium]|nr:GNAT family N-acetyltransferase [Chloroflexota bacterium]